MAVGNDKIKQICDELRFQTIDPAKKQAKEIIENAEIEALEIKNKAREEARELLKKTEKEINVKKDLANSSIKSACMQVVDKLKQDLERHFFHKDLKRLIDASLVDPDVLAKLINTIIKAIDEEGINSDISVYISKQIDSKTISALLGKSILDRLREKKVLEKRFEGGIVVKLHDDEMTLDVSDSALLELVSNYVRKDFREMLFNE